MRLITVRAPAGRGGDITELALQSGIKVAAVSTAKEFDSTGLWFLKDVVELETATPIAARFIDSLMNADFYDPKTFSFAVRHPEALFASTLPREEVQPVTRPVTDIYEELYQFTKITISLVGRVFISALLLSYGLTEDNLPLIIAALLFLPFHHHLLAISLGGNIKEWQFFKQGLLALIVSTLLIFMAGVCAAMLMDPPVLYDKFASPLTGALIAAIIGIAAALASIDDAGRRELIGLAATAHFTVYPAWLGLHMVFGFSDPQKAIEHLFSFLINLIAFILCAYITFKLAGMQGSGIRRFIHVLGTNLKKL